MIEVLKQMIAALEDCSANKHHSRNSAIQAGFKAITDLEKQNFAAIDWGLVHEKLELVWYRELSADEGLDEIQNLIDTTPQPIGFAVMERPLVGLTDEQIKDIANSCMWWVQEQDILDDAIELARAIEAAHGITQEKNT